MAGTGSAFYVDYSQLEKLSQSWGVIVEQLKSDSPKALLAAKRAAAVLTGHVRKQIAAGYEAKSVGTRTGGLARSFRDVAESTKEGLVFGTASDSVYARIQDSGGVITPSTRKALAVPLIQMAVGKWPRDWPKGELFRIRGKSGKSVLARRVGKDRVEAVYALVSSVTIRAKHYLEHAQGVAMNEVVEVLVDTLTEGL